MISSYVGENAEFERQYLSGELEVELTPQVRTRCKMESKILQILTLSLFDRVNVLGLDKKCCSTLFGCSLNQQ